MSTSSHYLLKTASILFIFALSYTKPSYASYLNGYIYKKLNFIPVFCNNIDQIVQEDDISIIDLRKKELIKKQGKMHNAITYPLSFTIFTQPSKKEDFKKFIEKNSENKNLLLISSNGQLATTISYTTKEWFPQKRIYVLVGGIETFIKDGCKIDK